MKKQYLRSLLMHLNEDWNKKEEKERSWTCFWIDVRLVSVL